MLPCRNGGLAITSNSSEARSPDFKNIADSNFWILATKLKTFTGHPCELCPVHRAQFVTNALKWPLWSLHLLLAVLLGERIVSEPRMLKDLCCTYGFVGILWQPVNINQQQQFYHHRYQAWERHCHAVSSKPTLQQSLWDYFGKWWSRIRFHSHT